MPSPDRAALDRIHVVLWARLTGTIGDGAAFVAISLAIEATGRRLDGDSNIVAWLDLAGWLMAQGATLDPPDRAGQVWAHRTAAGIRHSSTSAPQPPPGHWLS